MKKKKVNIIHLRKQLIANMEVNNLKALKGGTSGLPWQNPTRSCFFNCGETGGQTGPLCLTGNQTNCQ
ncbi:hypothetical protein [Kordia sp.]|uniref:hypothetical protein n=1 Tax=Kordia sp. TaxID=1965332 RepID=UPI003B5CFF7F